MALEIYEVPGSIDELFAEVEENDGSMLYRIINYNDGMEMDNNEAMEHFVETVSISENAIEEDLGTQITIAHPNYEKRIVINSGGLGDFFSHGFECSWEEEWK